MENTLKTLQAPTQEQADLAEVSRLVSEGRRVTDPELRRRITERGDQARRKMFEVNGLTNMAVDLIREGREED